MKAKYTWKPDIPDRRDYKLMVPKKIALPTKVDLRNKMSPVEDQGQLGSCTGNAIAGALEYLENKNLPKTKFVDISRLFIYYQERLIEGTVSQDAGAMIRTGVKVCAKIGACDEALWPYLINKFTRSPPVKAYTDAAKRKITQYQRVTSLQGLKYSLSQGFPVVFGFSVYDGFESDEVAKTGILNVPAEGETMLGGHAVLCVGYDDSIERIIVRNSWGPNWGMKGYFTMPYEYINDRDLSDDLWSIQKM